MNSTPNHGTTMTEQTTIDDTARGNSAWLERTTLMLKTPDRLNRLRDAAVLVAGVGGVGGVVAELLARAGIGRIRLIDADTVQPSNRNRQIVALSSTEGMKKVDVITRRLLDINPELILDIKDDFIEPETVDDVLTPIEGKTLDFVVDAIDTLACKTALIHKAHENGIRVVSSMGAGAKLDPTMVRIADLSDSRFCPLAKAVRRILRREGLTSGITVVYSDERPDREAMREERSRNKASIVGTISYMPWVFGSFCAAAVVQALVRDHGGTISALDGSDVVDG